jgi:hypothetical protein
MDTQLLHLLDVDQLVRRTTNGARAGDPVTPVSEPVRTRRRPPWRRRGLQPVECA